MAEELIRPEWIAGARARWEERHAGHDPKNAVPFADPPMEQVSALYGCVRFEIAWPRFATLTRDGRVSKSKQAGKLVPWLSMNRVNNMHRRVHQMVRIAWREATVEELAGWDFEQMKVPVRIGVQLYRVSAQVMDVGAVVEGAKPIIDGMVAAGLLAGDTPKEVAAIEPLPVVGVGRKGEHRVKVIVCTHPVQRHRGEEGNG